MRLHGILWMPLAAHTCILAADFWITRDPAQWSDEQIRKIVTDSPWAKEANVSLKDRNLRLDPPNEPARRPPGAPRDQPGSPTRPEGDFAGTSAAATPSIVIRWESAAPVCEACTKGGMERYLFSCTSKLLYLSDLAQKFDALAREFYIVSLSNYPNVAGEGKTNYPPQHSAAANAAMENLAHRLQQTTFLKRAAKSPILPSHAAALPAGRVLLIVLFFPRTEPITLADKEVLFESTSGTMDLKAKFSLQKMVFRGRLDL